MPRGSLTPIRRHLGLVALLMMSVVLVVLAVELRGRYLTSSASLNPDEAELLAAGRRAALNLLPYVTYTTPTYLFEWPFALGVLAILGVPMTLTTAHLLSALAYLVFALIGWVAISRRLGWLTAALLILPTTVLLFAAHSIRPKDYLALGTELLPAFLVLVGAAVLFVPGTGRPTRTRLAVACFLAGASLWAKPQVAPLALALCVVGVLLRALPDPIEAGMADDPGDGIVPADEGGRSAPDTVQGTATDEHVDRTSSSGAGRGGLLRDLAVAGVAFAAPTVIVLGILVVTGMIPRFLAEPVALIRTYVETRQVVGVGAPPRSLPERVVAAVRLVQRQPGALLWAIPGLAGLIAAARTRRGANVAIWLGAWLLPILGSLATLTVVWPLYPHYLNLLYAGCLVAAMAGIAVARTLDPRPAAGAFPPGAGRATRIVLVAVVTCAAIAIVVAPLVMSPIRANVRAVARAVTSPVQSIQLLEGCERGSRVLVWGHAAELYADYDWQPASRYVVTWSLGDWGETETYERTMVDEVTSNPPTCVVEALGPTFFGGFGGGAQITVRLPALGDYLARCYKAASAIVEANRPVTVWRWSGSCPRP